MLYIDVPGVIWYDDTRPVVVCDEAGKASLHLNLRRQSGGLTVEVEGGYMDNVREL